MKGQFKIYGPIKKRGAKQRLTLEQKQQMRNDFIKGGMSIDDLVKKYKMCFSSIYKKLKATKPIII